MKFFAILCLCLLSVGNGVSQDTFKSRINPVGTQEVENLLRYMIRQVNYLIKQKTTFPRMNIYNVEISNLNVQELDTANVNIIMDNNRLGVRVTNAKVRASAHASVLVNLLFFSMRVAASFNVFAYGINGQLDSQLGVRNGHLYPQNMGCSLSISNPGIDLQIPAINHLVNQIVAAMMPQLTPHICAGIKTYSQGMVKSAFEILPTNVDVFNMFRLSVPVRTFKSWNRHMVAGFGAEIRPSSNTPVSMSGLRILPLPEAEDNHMACLSMSDFLINTASRTLLPVGKEFVVNLSDVLSMFFKTAFSSQKMLFEGKILESPIFFVEENDLLFSVKAIGTLVGPYNLKVPITEERPLAVKVTAPHNETPLFKNVKIEMGGPMPFTVNIDLSNILDHLTGMVDKLYSQFAGKRRLIKRATSADLTRVINEMFLSRYLSNFQMSLGAKHGALLGCASGSPTTYAKNLILGLLKKAFF